MTNEELIKVWEVMSDRCDERAEDQTNEFTVERLRAEAVVYRLCAHDLLRISK